jgi:hypothetical protein
VIQSRFKKFRAAYINRRYKQEMGAFYDVVSRQVVVIRIQKDAVVERVYGALSVFLYQLLP